MIAYQAVFVTVMGYGVWYRMMRRFPINQVMPFTLLVPVFGVISGVVLLGDPLTGLMLLGGGADPARRRHRRAAPAAGHRARHQGRRVGMSDIIQSPSPNYNERPAGKAIDMLLLHYTGMRDARCRARAAVRSRGARSAAII